MGRLCSDQKEFFFHSLPIHFAGSDGFKKREKIPWEMWQSSWWHGGGAGWVLVELLGQHTRLLTRSQAPAGHQAAADRHQRHQDQDPSSCHEKASQTISGHVFHSRPRALFLYAQVLTLSVAARR